MTVALLLAAASFTLTPLDSGTRVRLQAVSIGSDGAIWASGVDGTYTRSTDGGATWRAGVVDGAAELQFRDVHAVDARTAYLLSAGPGEASRIYKTVDGGARWTLQFTNPVETAFYDCMDFWDPEHGVAYSDSLGGMMVMVATADGERWQRVPAERLPAPLEGEGGFAASGTCVTTTGADRGFVAMGVRGARVLRTSDGGASWDVVDTPIPHANETSGLTSVEFLPSGQGVAAGGDIAAPEAYADNVAVSEDFGESWWIASGPTFPGAVYGIAFAPGAPTLTLVAVGPGGVSYSTDNAGTWTSVANDAYWSLAFTADGVGYLTGPDGRLARLELAF